MAAKDAPVEAPVEPTADNGDNTPDLGVAPVTTKGYDHNSGAFVA